MATRYWVAASTGIWGDTANWSTSSGGAGGSSVPAGSDDAILNGDGLGSCLLTANVSVASLTITSGYSNVFSCGGFNLTCPAVSIATTGFLVGLSGSTWTVSTTLVIEKTGGVLNLQVSGTAWTINGPSGGTITNATLQNVDASPGADLSAINCTDSGSNSGFVFTYPLALTFSGVGNLLFGGESSGSLFGGYVRTGDVIEYTNPAECLFLVAGNTINLASPYMMLQDLYVSYDGKELRFSEIATPGHGSATFALDATVVLKFDFGTGLKTYFDGRVRSRKHIGVTQEEAIEYVALGKQQLANEVDLIGRLGWPKDEFVAGYTTIAEGVTEVLYNNSAQLNANFTIASTIGAPGVEGLGAPLLDNLTLEGMGVTEGLKRLLQLQPTHRVFFDDITSKWIFPSLVAAPTINLPINLVDMENDTYQIDLNSRYTALQLYAQYDAPFFYGVKQAIELTAGWEANFEADWTIKRATSTAVLNQFGLAYAWVFRRWTFSPITNKSVSRDYPYQVFVLVPYDDNFAWVPIQAYVDWRTGVAMTKVPITIKGNPHHPGDCKGPLAAAIVYIDTKSMPLNVMDTQRYPTSGYLGTAYSAFGVQRVKRKIVDPEKYTYDNAAADLGVLQDAVITADIPIVGDPIEEFLNLQRRVTVSHAGKVTGLESVHAYVTSYRYSFGKPGKSTIGISNDKNLVMRTV